MISEQQRRISELEKVSCCEHQTLAEEFYYDVQQAVEEMAANKCLPSQSLQNRIKLHARKLPSVFGGPSSSSNPRAPQPPDVPVAQGSPQAVMSETDMSIPSCNPPQLRTGTTRSTLSPFKRRRLESYAKEILRTGTSISDPSRCAGELLDIQSTDRGKGDGTAMENPAVSAESRPTAPSFGGIDSSFVPNEQYPNSSEPPDQGADGAPMLDDFMFLYSDADNDFLFSSADFDTNVAQPMAPNQSPY